MFNKFKTLVSEFVDSCKKSKEKAISNIALLVLGIAIAGIPYLQAFSAFTTFIWICTE